MLSALRPCLFTPTSELCGRSLLMKIMRSLVLLGCVVALIVLSIARSRSILEPPEELPPTGSKGNSVDDLSQPSTAWQPAVEERRTDALGPAPNATEQQDELFRYSTRSDFDIEAVTEGGRYLKYFYPDLDWYRGIHKKSLMSKADVERLQSFLTTQNLIATARELLISASELSRSTIGELARVQVLDALAEAAAIPDNPIQESLIAMFKELLLANRPMDGFSDEERSALAADKLHTYYIYKKYFPDNCDAFAQAQKHEGLTRLITYADGNESKLAASFFRNRSGGRR